MDDDQRPNVLFKHYCRLCNKGFMSGMALGGHMRAHGVINGDEHDQGINWKWNSRHGNGDVNDENDHHMVGGNNNKRNAYQLRTNPNPNRLKSCRACETCGMEFLSWKSFLDHGKCCSGDATSNVVSGRTSKRKKTIPLKAGFFGSTTYLGPSDDQDEDDMFLARCLVQLSNTPVVMAKVEESPCVSAEWAEKRQNPRAPATTLDDKTKWVSNPDSNKVGGGLFKCKACNKVFNSHQALGGHRASHKKVKGCYAAKFRDNNSKKESEYFLPSKPPPVATTTYNSQIEQASRKKSKVHECSICHRVFTSGQALGGHKRCHWITSNNNAAPVKFQLQENNINPNPNLSSDKLDLNAPPWAHVLGDQWDPKNPTRFNVPSETMNLHCPWINGNNKVQHFRPKDNKIDDEADSEFLKLAKLGDLNDLKEDMTNDGNSCQWLQVGRGTPTESATVTTADDDA